MSGSSETELRQLIQDLGISGGFLGTFDCRFPGFIQKDKKQTAIVNTGPREQGGVHWIALAWDPTSYKMFLFDPLGWTKGQLRKYYGFSYENLVKRSALTSPDRCVTLVKNNQAIQCTCAGSCGLFCVLFLYAFSRRPSNPYSDPLIEKMTGIAPTIHPLCPDKLHHNQAFLYQFLKTQSQYFKKNETLFVSNTKIGLINTH